MLTHNQVRRGIAIHEAGHAVAAVVLGCTVTAVELGRPHRNGFIGRCCFDDQSRAALSRADELVVFAAGDMAITQLLTGEQRDWFDAAIRHRSNAAQRVHSRIASLAGIHAAEYADQVHHSDARQIRSIADPQQPGDLWIAQEHAERDAAAIVQLHWPAVVAVAAELLASGELSGERVAAIVHEQVGGVEADLSTPNPAHLGAVCLCVVALVEARPIASADECWSLLRRVLIAFAGGEAKTPAGMLQLFDRRPRIAGETAAQVVAELKLLGTIGAIAELPSGSSAGDEVPERTGAADVESCESIIIPAAALLAVEMIEQGRPAGASAAFATFTAAMRRIMHPCELPGSWLRAVRSFRRGSEADSVDGVAYLLRSYAVEQLQVQFFPTERGASC